MPGVFFNTGFPGSSADKQSACHAGDLGSILGWEDPLEKGMAAHSSILVWMIPWTEEPGRLQSIGHDWATNTFPPLSFFSTTYLQSMGSQRVGHNWAMTHTCLTRK